MCQRQLLALRVHRRFLPGPDPHRPHQRKDELFLWNKENLISEIDQFDAALAQLREALVADDRDKLEEMFRLSTQRRAAFDKKDS